MSLIIGKDFPGLQIHLYFRSGDPHQPYAVKIKLGRVMIGGKSTFNKLNSNSINPPFNHGTHGLI